LLLTPDLPCVDMARRRAREAALLLLPLLLRAATVLAAEGKVFDGEEAVVVADEDPPLEADARCMAALPEPDIAFRLANA
jgi:hypothetical protein